MFGVCVEDSLIKPTKYLRLSLQISEKEFHHQSFLYLALILMYLVITPMNSFSCVKWIHENKEQTYEIDDWIHHPQIFSPHSHVLLVPYFDLIFYRDTFTSSQLVSNQCGPAQTSAESVVSLSSSKWYYVCISKIKISLLPNQFYRDTIIL